MACGTFTVTKVPQLKLQQTIDLFKANKPPPTSVTSTADGMGTYTVIAKFPPCPPNTSHTDGSIERRS
jgi:hypothetical protein